MFEQAASIKYLGWWAMQEDVNSRAEEVAVARQAVLEAYKAHAGDLTARAVVLTRNRGLAQDVLQETFLRFFLTKMHGEKIADEGAWLRRVMFSLIKDWKRSSNAEDLVSLQDVESMPAQNADERPSQATWFPLAARGLAPRELECLKLRVEGFDYREIASEMRIRIGTVGVLLNRAMQKIKQRSPVKNRPFS
jgi:RNA polymerase sigma factor (sigma-70 family)